MTRLNDMTVEHLGDTATEQDLEQFKAWARELMARDGLSEDEAVDTLWGEGDYLKNARRLGLSNI